MTEIIAPENCSILRIHGENGNFKLVNDDCVTVTAVDTDTRLRLKAFSKGVISFKCKAGDKVNKGDVLCVLSQCPHDIVFMDICGLCSAAIEIKNMGNGNIQCNSGNRMAMVHANKNLVVNEKTAMEFALKDSLNLLKKKKLSLLIDLDLTILHTTNNPVSPELQDVYHYTLKDERTNCESLQHHTKMRPYLKQFLKNMHEIFELHIYTFGNRSYADKIREFIDPDKKLFGGRIISRDDSFDMQKKTANLKSLFPRGDNMVCIIDDRPEVWNNAPNFIHVKPYIYFPNAEDINNPNEKSKDKTSRGVMGFPPKKVTSNKDKEELQEDKDKQNETDPNIPSGILPDDDEYLLTLENILFEIHRRFYTSYDKLREEHSETEIVEQKLLPDVKLIMNGMRSEALRGCQVAFSGLIPTNMKVKETQAYQILRNLGANYQQNVILPSLKTEEFKKNDSDIRYTTHLILHSDGSEKMKKVSQYITKINSIISANPTDLSQSIHRVSMVNINWLWYCYFLWSKVDESQFLFSENLLQLAAPEGVKEIVYEDSLSQHSSISMSSNPTKRGHEDDDESAMTAKRHKVSREKEQEVDDLMEDLNNISDDSHDHDQDSSSDEDDWPDNNVMLHYTPEQRLAMLKEVDEAMDEEKLNGGDSDSSSDDDDDSSRSSSSSSKVDDNNISDQEGPRIKNPPKHWEKREKENSDKDDEEDEEDSSGEQEWDYATFERDCEEFGTMRNSDSDDEGGSDNDL